MWLVISMTLNAAFNPASLANVRMSLSVYSFVVASFLHSIVYISSEESLACDPRNTGISTISVPLNGR